MSKEAVQNIVGAVVSAMNFEEGFTIHADSGNPFQGTGAYLVGGIIPSVSMRADLSVYDIHAVVSEWYKGAKALDGDGAVVGGWYHDGQVHLDLVSLVTDLEDALLLGKLWSQNAIGKLDGNDYSELVLA